MKKNPGRKVGNGVARYKGTRMRKWGKWVAEVRQPNSRTRIWLGSYETEKEAARAYDVGVVCLRGPSTSLNFPEDPPDILTAPDSMSTSQIQVAAAKHARKDKDDGVVGPVGEKVVNVVSESSGDHPRQTEVAGECYSFHDQIEVEQLSMETVYPPFTAVEPKRDVSDVVFFEF